MLIGSTKESVYREIADDNLVGMQCLVFFFFLLLFFIKVTYIFFLVELRTYLSKLMFVYVYKKQVVPRSLKCSCMSGSRIAHVVAHHFVFG